jgi:hypothetical protein
MGDLPRIGLEFYIYQGTLFFTADIECCSGVF